jgi:hypothetical protein
VHLLPRPGRNPRAHAAHGHVSESSASGAMEYGVCEGCNNGTRGSDAVAALIARMHPDNGEKSWQAEEIRKLISAIDTYAPGVREELSLPGKFNHEWKLWFNSTAASGSRSSHHRTKESSFSTSLSNFPRSAVFTIDK